MSEYIFCKIAYDELPCFKLFEDNLVKAFLDLNPTLRVIYKSFQKNILKIFLLPDTIIARINQVCKKMALLCKEKLDAAEVNILNASGKDAQQSVFHLYFHVVSRFKKDGLDLCFHEKFKYIENIKKIQEKLLS